MTRRESWKTASLALQRFGMGATPGAADAIAGDPKSALLDEVEEMDVEIRDAGLPDYAAACDSSVRSFEAAKLVFQREARARANKQISAKIGFLERLVLFYSNHFSMSYAKASSVLGTVGQWERSVVRRHVLGRFSDMLVETTRHPSMIAFLDNDRSISPRSPYGRVHQAGATENLAREVLELHTLGTGHYAESDVAAMTKILTGWSIVRGIEADTMQNGGNPLNRGQFIYRPEWHEPGPVVFAGVSYPDTGVKQGEKVLVRIGRSSATGLKLAYKLARHFISDNPTPDMVAPLHKAFVTSRGNLKDVAVALIRLEAAWKLPLTKTRTPYEFMVAQYRATGSTFGEDDLQGFLSALTTLRHGLWLAPSPEGYSDDSLAWSTPDAMPIRIDAAQYLAERFCRRKAIDVPALARRLYGDALSTETLAAVTRAGKPVQALTVLFASPEFQRR